jgi:hypothetical protein
MRIVGRFPFALEHRLKVEMPINADIIGVEVRPGSGPCILAVCNTELPKERRAFCLIRSGDEIPFDCWYLKSFYDPPYTWHLLGTLDHRKWENPQEFVDRFRKQGS